MKTRNNKLEYCHRSLTVLTRSTTKCTTKPVGKKLDTLAIEFEFEHSRRLSVLFSSKSHLSLVNNTLYPSPLPSGLVSEHEQIGGQIIRMRYRMSVIYGHPVIAATRALRSQTTWPKETEALGTRMGEWRGVKHVRMSHQSQCGLYQRTNRIAC